MICAETRSSPARASCRSSWTGRQIFSVVVGVGGVAVVFVAVVVVDGGDAV